MNARSNQYIDRAVPARALILLVAHSVAFAGPHYYFLTANLTTPHSQTNDRGAIAGSAGDSFVHGASWANGDFVAAMATPLAVSSAV
jgi:hypothetical protein